MSIFQGRMKTNDMKALMHLKGTWPGKNLNNDEFWCFRLSHPGVVIYQMKVVCHKVRRKNVDGSAKMRLVFAKELGDHWGQCPQETGFRRLRNRLETNQLLGAVFVQSLSRV